MFSQLKQMSADHRYLLETVARQAGFASPLAINLDEFYVPLTKAARKGEIRPIDGVLARAQQVGTSYTAAQVHAVLDAQMTYLEAIGAIGPEAPPDSL